MTRILSPMQSSFSERLVQVNQLDERNFHGWCLRPGMLFAADRSWWGAEEPRPRPHEGLDLIAFIDSNGGVGSLGEGVMIPALFAGQVVAIFTDFLGQSLLVTHQQHQGQQRFHSIYAHVVAGSGIAIGYHCAEGEVLARVAKSKRPGIPAHLHLSTLWLSGALVDEPSWPKLTRSTGSHWCDPLEFITGWGNKPLQKLP